MTTLRSRRALALVLQLIALASPLAAQAPTARDSAHAAQQLDDSLRLKVFPTLDRYCKTSSKTAYMRDGACRHYARLFGKVSAAESLLVAYTPSPVPVPTPAPTPTPTPSPADTAAPVVIVTPGPTPGPVLFTHPFGPPANGAVLATLPQDTVDASYPAIARRVSCSNLQACLDTAKTGDEIRLARGASFTDVVVRPTSRASWVVVRTDVTDVELGGPWERMTSARAAALNLATIRSSGGAASALTVNSAAHHVRLVGMLFTTSTPTTSIIRIGLGESDPAQLPHHITIDRSVVDPGPSGDVRRCLAMDGAHLAVLSSTLANCHSNRGDSQGAWAYNAKGPLRIEYNAIQGGHQAFFLGGADPAISGQVPSDVVVRRNDFTRPYSWRCTGPVTNNIAACLTNQWRAKTLIELKLGRRILFEGNVVAHVYPDAQDGFAFLLKTENQDGGTAGNWSETSDITVRYNRIVGAAGLFNLAALPAGPGIPMSRITAYANEADSIATGPYRGSVDCALVQGVADVVLRDNWCRNPSGRSAFYFVGTAARFVAERNTAGGEYGWKGDGAVWSALAPGAITTGNVTVPWGTAFSSWPAAPADSIRSALLAGVVVAP